MSTLTVTLGGTTTTNIMAISGTITKRGTNTCRIKLREADASALAYSVGDTALVTVGSTDILGGRIETILQVLPEPRSDTAASGDILTVLVEVRSYDERTKRRVIEAATYQNMTTSAIMEAIVDTYLDGEGFTKTGIDSGGTTQTEVVYRGVTVFEAFNDLADREGWYWLIDASGDVVFEDPSTTSAPFNITSGSKPIWDLRVRDHLSQYANSVLVVGAAGAAPSASVSETIVFADTAAEGFDRIRLEHEVESVTSVTLKRKGGDTSYTVGEVGVDADAGKDVHYEEGSRVLVLNTFTASYGDKLVVVYTSPQTLLVQVDDAAAISARQTAEGGSGRYEKKISAPGIDTSTEATALANAILAEATTLPQDVSYVTAQDGLLPGQAQTITLAERSLSGSYFVESVDFRRVAITGTNTFRIEYTVQLRNRTGESLDQFAARWLRDREVDDPTTALPSQIRYIGREASETLTIDSIETLL